MLPVLGPHTGDGCDPSNRTKWGRDDAHGWQGGVERKATVYVTGPEMRKLEVAECRLPHSSARKPAAGVRHFSAALTFAAGAGITAGPPVACAGVQGRTVVPPEIMD